MDKPSSLTTARIHSYRGQEAQASTLDIPTSGLASSSEASYQAKHASSRINDQCITLFTAQLPSADPRSEDEAQLYFPSRCPGRCGQWTPSRMQKQGGSVGIRVDIVKRSRFLTHVISSLVYPHQPSLYTQSPDTTCPPSPPPAYPRTASPVRRAAADPPAGLS